MLAGAGMRVLRWLLLVMLVVGGPACAGVLTRDALARHFPAPVVVGERATDVPAWPLFKQNGTAMELVGYAFESADLAPIPGFAGVPINLLVAIDPKGTFISVEVISQHEPVFLDGLGEAPLLQFVRQYRGKSLAQNIDVGGARAGAGDARQVHLDGVSKATASVRILNQTVLAAALQVARARLGFAPGRDPSRLARIRNVPFRPMSWRELEDAGLLWHARVRNRDVERLFDGTDGAGLDPQVAAHPDDAFIDLYLAWASVPEVGRNLLAPRSWNKLTGRLEPGDHAILVMGAGPYRIFDDDFVRASVPRKLVLRQDKLPIEMRDLDLDPRLTAGAPVGLNDIAVLRVIGQAALDPAHALEFALPITRSKGIVYPERITRELPLKYRLPEEMVEQPGPAQSSWSASWHDRRVQIAITGAALALLAAGLAFQRRLVAAPVRFKWMRRGWLLFTVAFIGYRAQGQLSIVNLTAVVQALREHRSLDFLLFDPMTVLLWGFVLVALLAWGRGVFCGWLCPFGALQEFVGDVARWLRLPQLRVRTGLDARIRRIKYAVLALLLGLAAFTPALADRFAEVEPFKTAITLNFVRDWPYVAYAAGLLAAGMFIYKFFCRYLCPLGAALALLGRLRLIDSIPRRSECGSPCQTCRHRCGYGAIDRSGKVDYDECFQCLECVVIHESDEQCAPRIMELKRARSIPIVPVNQLTDRRA